MQAKFEPRRLKQARALRRMTLADLGARTDVTRQGLSQFENGDRVPAPETLLRIAAELDFPIEFFWRGVGPVERSPRSLVHYRSLRRTRDTILDQQRAAAVLDMAAAVMDAMQEHVDYADADIPKISPDVDPLSLSGDEVEEVANAVRKELGLGLGPISDVTLLVENRSIPVMHFPLPDAMDGLSAYYGERPFIVVSSDATRDRSRLNVAHEFGHLVLHESISVEGELDIETFRLVEDQAWRFAGALMLPAESFLKDVYSTSLDALLLLKKRWGVSVAAIIKRLQVLGILNQDQVKYLNIQKRQRNWSRAEPGDDVQRETSRLFRRAADYLSAEAGIPLHQFAAEARLPLPILASALETTPAELLPPRLENVVQFRPKS